MNHLNLNSHTLSKLPQRTSHFNSHSLSLQFQFKSFSHKQHLSFPYTLCQLISLSNIQISNLNSIQGSSPSNQSNSFQSMPTHFSPSSPRNGIFFGIFHSILSNPYPTHTHNFIPSFHSHNI